MPSLLIERLLNVATPLTADCVSVPLSVAPVVPVPLVMAMLTEAVLLVSRTPLLSSTLTVTAGVSDAPDAALVGCWLKANEAAVCGQVTLADKIGGPGSYAQMNASETKGIAESAYVNFPDALMVVAPEIGDVQVLVLSPHRLPFPPVPSRIHTDAFVPSVVT
jgi:hypothetical protein